MSDTIITARGEYKVPPHQWALTRHMAEVMKDHGAGLRATSIRDSRHGTILALVSRGLLRFTDYRKATVPTAVGWAVVRKLLAAEADLLCGDD